MPRLEADPMKKRVDLLLIKVDGQVVGPIAGPLLVAGRRARHLIVIAERPDEIFRVRFVRGQSTAARKFLSAGYLDQNILQASGEADDAVGLALAGHDGLRTIEIIRSRRARAAATRQRKRNRHPDDGANHIRAYRER